MIYVTGGSRGIGLTMALKAAKDGAKIVVAAKTADPHPKVLALFFLYLKIFLYGPLFLSIFIRLVSITFYMWSYSINRIVNKKNLIPNFLKIPSFQLPGTIFTAAKEIEAAGGQALPCVVDVRDEKAVQEIKQT